jgi:hypothetical protein
MFSKKLSLTLLVLIIGLSACGSQPVAESNSSDVVEQSQPVLPSQKESASAAQTETISVNTQSAASLTYPIVDTDQGNCYDAQSQVACPDAGMSFYGQDAQYKGSQPSYTNNSDGTITDNVTGLMWQQDPGAKMTYSQAVAGASNVTLAGYSDWRLPSIKELYSLIQFDGLDPSGPSASNLVPFIDTDYFNFEYGDESAGERVIDSQWATSTKYVSTTMNGNETMFGVNFADGRIKGYGTNAMRGGEKTFFVIYVRGNTAYGQNNFSDNGNGTISDNATGLSWTQNDSSIGLKFEAALKYCESLDYAGSSDWRLPNVKELQSIVDYSRSPDTSNSAAIDLIFNISSITNEAGQVDYPAFWSSTTHANLRSGGNAAYVNFGRSMGNMNGQWMDVHGAGAQRSDPKTGSASDYPTGHGPQGDAIRVDNYVRCVSDKSTINLEGNPSSVAAETMTQPPSGQEAGALNQADGQGRPGVDLASAAAQLGVTEEALRSALGPPPPDLEAAAVQLGVSVQDLIAALGIFVGGPPNGGGAGDH